MTLLHWNWNLSVSNKRLMTNSWQWNLSCHGSKLWTPTMRCSESKDKAARFSKICLIPGQFKHKKLDISNDLVAGRGVTLGEKSKDFLRPEPLGAPTRLGSYQLTGFVARKPTSLCIWHCKSEPSIRKVYVHFAAIKISVDCQNSKLWS